MFGRETIQQVGLLCIIVAFPIAELPQSLVSTSVSFTDTYTLSVVGCSCNPRPEEVWRVPRTLVLVVFLVPQRLHHFSHFDVDVIVMKRVKHGSPNAFGNGGALLVQFVEEHLT
jgi:hypothetical protein